MLVVPTSAGDALAAGCGPSHAAEYFSGGTAHSEAVPGAQRGRILVRVQGKRRSPSSRWATTPRRPQGWLSDTAAQRLKPPPPTLQIAVRYKYMYPIEVHPWPHEAKRRITFHPIKLKINMLDYLCPR